MTTLSERHSMNRAIDRIWKGLGALSRRPLLAGTLIAASAVLGSLCFALANGFFVPQAHDEFSFLLAGETFAKGHLSYPAHPFWEHFVSFHILAYPRYACGYGPAQGLFLALGFLLGKPIVGVWISVAAMCAAVYWALRAWLAPRWAVIGGFFCAFQFGIYTYWSQRYWGGAPAALGGALVLGSARFLYKKVSPVYGFLFALGLGILANSRPLEGLFTAAVAGVIILNGIFQKKISLSEVLRKTAAPFFLTLGILAVLTGIYNQNITGSPFTLPQAFLGKFESRMGFFLWQPLGEPRHFIHQVMKDFEETFTLYYYQLQKTFGGFIQVKLEALNNFKEFYAGALYSVLILLTLPRLWKYRKPRFILSVLILHFIAGILPLAVKPQEHYLAPLLVLFVALAASSLRCFSELRTKDIKLGKWLVVFFLLYALVPRPSTLILYPYQDSFAEERAALVQDLKTNGGRHLILVKYAKTFNHQHFEWVYNGADIDSQQIVWARSMDDAKDKQLIEYYKDRNIWVLTVDNAGDPSLRPLRVDPDFTFFVAPF